MFTYDEGTLEDLNDLEVLKSKLHSRLDPYIRVPVQKRGVTVIQNAYTGFDTEYELLDHKKNLNKLLSVQIATQTRTLIKVPLYNTYDVSYVHPLSSEITTFYKPKKVNWGDPHCDNSGEKKLNELELLNESIKNSILRLRTQFMTHDLINSELISILKGVEGLNYFEDHRRDQIVFSYPLSNLSSEIVFPQTGYSLKKVVELSNS